MRRSQAYAAFKSAATKRFSDLDEASAIYEFSRLPEAKPLYRAYTEARPDTTPQESKQASEPARSTAFGKLRDAAVKRFVEVSETDAIARFAATPEGREMYADYRESVLYGEPVAPPAAQSQPRRVSEPRPQQFTGEVVTSKQASQPAPVPDRLDCRKVASDRYHCQDASTDRYAAEVLRVAHERPDLRAAADLFAEADRRLSGVA